MNCCYVSMYYDIDRAHWENFGRSFETYLERFTPFINLFSKKVCGNNHMILFMDDRHLDSLNIDISSHAITIIPINSMFLENNIYCWSLLSREREIMSSLYYKELIEHRNHCPETRFPEYTLINHAKIDFVNYVADYNLTSCSILAWVDFGFFSKASLIPSSLLDLNHFDIRRISYTLINDIEERDRDIIYTLKYAPEKIGGFFFLGKKDVLKVYQYLFHESLMYYQSQNICDDDQALALHTYFKYPELFFFPETKGWHTVLKAYAIKIPKFVISFCLWGNENRYTVGLIENLKLALFFYPEFTPYVYIHYKTATEEYIQSIHNAHPYVEIIIKNEELIRPKRFMLWRIEPLEDKTVDLFISRDTDTRIFAREVLAVRQWLSSNKKIHIMRDHPQHFNKILGGMFGVRTEHLREYNWSQMIEAYYRIHGDDENDQHFLEKFLYNMTPLSDKMIHDEIKRYEEDYCLSFPSLFERNHFTGCYIYEDGSGDPQTEEVLQNYIKDILPDRLSPSPLSLETKLEFISKNIECIYIIHYTKLKERKQMMDKQLRNHLFDIFFKDRIKWVDTFDREFLDYSRYKSFYSKWIKRDITTGEIANMMAHKHVFNDICSSSSTLPYYVIEDDCIFKDNFIDNLYHTLHLLQKEKWDMVCVGGPITLNTVPARALLKSTKIRFHSKEIEIFTPSSPAPVTVSSMLYKKSGLKKVLSSPFINFPYPFPSDHALWEANKFHNVVMKWVQPFLTYEGSKVELFPTSFERGF